MMPWQAAGMIRTLSLAFALAFAAPASAQSISAQFQAWLQSDLWPDAKSKGVSRATCNGCP